MAISSGAAMLGGAALGLLGSKGSKQGNTTSTNTNTPWGGVQPYLTDLYRNASTASGGQSLLDPAKQQMGATIRGDYLDPSSNPALAPYVRDALGLVGSDFMGRYGGMAGSNIGNSGFQEALTRNLANTALPIYANAYNTERQNQLQASQLAPAMDVAHLAPYQALSNIYTGGNFGTSTSQQPYFTNPIAGAMGGALSAGALYRMLGT